MDIGFSALETGPDSPLRIFAVNIAADGLEKGQNTCCLARLLGQPDKDSLVGVQGLLK